MLTVTAGGRFDIRIAEIAQGADTFSGLTDFTRVEGVAFGRAELATDHLIKGGGIALDVDAFHEHPIATREHEFDVQSLIAFVARQHRFDAHEVQALVQGQGFHAGDVVFNQRGGIDNARAQTLRVGKLRLVQTFDGRDRADRPDAILLAFAHGDRHKARVPLGGQLTRGVQHLDVDISARQVEIAQELLVQLQPLGHEGITPNDLAQNAGLLGFQDLPQATVGIGAVAHEGQTLHLNRLALVDLEHQIDAVVGPADDLGVNRGGQTALHPVRLGDGGSVGLGGGRVVDVARFGLQQALQCLILEALVALKVDHVQHRQFFDNDLERAALRQKFHRFKQTRVHDALIGVVQLPRVQRLTATDSRIRQDGGGIDPRVAFDGDIGKAVALRQSRCEERHGNDCSA